MAIRKTELPRELEIYSPEEVDIIDVEEEPPVLNGDLIIYDGSDETKATICVSDELMNHYTAVITTRDSVINDPESSGSAKAAILNSTTAMLKQLLAMLTAANNADTIGRIQQAIFSALGEASPELRDKVLSLLEQKLENV